MSKEEIENILGNINFEVETEQEWLEPLGLDRNTWKQILNYITDLQQENKQLKEDKKKAIEFIKSWVLDEYSIAVKDKEDDDCCFNEPDAKEKLLEILGDKK